MYSQIVIKEIIILNGGCSPIGNGLFFALNDLRLTPYGKKDGLQNNWKVRGGGDFNIQR